MTATVEALALLALLANFAIDEMLTDVVAGLDEGMDPAVLAANLSVLFYKTDPHRSCTLAAYALVQLAQQRREGRR